MSRAHRNAAALLVLGVAALGVRVVHLGHTPHYDEFYHILAARAWIDHGTLCIHHCRAPYTRALLFTALVAGMFKIAGVSIIAARIPSVVAGALWVVVVAWWTGRVAGRTAGWTAGALLLVDPGAIYLSQLARFYALHALAFWLGAVWVFFALEPRRPRRSRAGYLAAAAAAFAVALHLQITTMIGLAALGVWAVMDLAGRGLERVRTRRSWQWGAAVVAAGMAGGLLWFTLSGHLAHLWYQYQWTNLWTNENSSDPRFFFLFFRRQYDWLWELLPIAAAVSLYRAPRAALFLITVFATGFVLHSFAGFKAFRVIYYLVPFMLALWGIALANAVPALLRLAGDAAERVAGHQARAVRRAGALTLLLVFAGFVLIGNDMLATTRLMLTRSDRDYPPNNPPYRGYADWASAAPQIRPRLSSARVVVVTAVNKALWYLGRADVAISQNQMYDGHGGFSADFAPDYQSGVPLIRRPRSMERLLACYPSGLVVSERGHWRRASAVPDTVADIVERYAQPIKVAGDPDLLVFRWTHPAAIAGVDCDPLPLDPAALPRGPARPGREIDEEGLLRRGFDAMPRALAVAPQSANVLAELYLAIDPVGPRRSRQSGGQDPAAAQQELLHQPERHARESRSVAGVVPIARSRLELAGQAVESPFEAASLGRDEMPNHRIGEVNGVEAGLQHPPLELGLLPADGGRLALRAQRIGKSAE